MKQQYYLFAQKLLEDLRRIRPTGYFSAAFFALLIIVLLINPSNVLTHGLAAAVVPQNKTAEIEKVMERVETKHKKEAVSAEKRFAARVGITHEAIDLDAGIIDIRKIEPLPLQKLANVEDDVLWLARCIYSETNRPEEMELVAWAIRNRVETGYRGKTTYKSVVLDPWQFSAFNHNSGKRGYFLGLTPESKADKWQEALTIARVVKDAPAKLRPFSKKTRHYYSERSMVGRSKPAWAEGQHPVRPNRRFEVEARRFRFYEGVA